MRTIAFGSAVLLFTSVLANAQDLETAYKNLKDAESKKDADLVKKWAGETSKAARAAVATPEPAAADAKAAWTSRVDYAKQVDTYTEYAMYALVLQPIEAPKVVDLCEALEAQNPKSQYLPQIAARCIVGLSQSGNQAKIVPFGERALERDPSNEDVLLVLADSYQSAKEPDKALATAAKLVAALSEKPKPAGIDDAVWQKKKDAMLGRGYWIIGMIHAERNQHAETDKALRSALPLIQGDPAMKAPALFYLGVANYQLGRASKNRAVMTEAAQFSEESAAIPGPYQALALKNAKSIRAEIAQMPRTPVRRKK
ncbi:MAG: hypothetical protein ABI823_09200 [Bryobacteraceae bacterium]